MMSINRLSGPMNDRKYCPRSLNRKARVRPAVTSTSRKRESCVCLYQGIRVEENETEVVNAAVVLLGLQQPGVVLGRVVPPGGRRLCSSDRRSTASRRKTPRTSRSRVRRRAPASISGVDRKEGGRSLDSRANLTRGEMGGAMEPCSKPRRFGRKWPVQIQERVPRWNRRQSSHGSNGTGKGFQAS